MMELYCRNDENLVLRNNEKIEWAAGGVLENLYYRLYDEAGREVPLTAETASKIKVCMSYYSEASFVIKHFNQSYALMKYES